MLAVGWPLVVVVVAVVVAKPKEKKQLHMSSMSNLSQFNVVVVRPGAALVNSFLSLFPSVLFVSMKTT